jgi:arsenite methyltransferase
MSAAGDPLAALLDGELGGCCADVYELPAVRWLLDGQLHPGGRALSLRAAQLAGIGAGSRVADVASGGGATALLLAEQFRAEVVGVERGAEAVARATAAAAQRGLDGAARFVAGDAAALPLPDDGMDAVVCECSLCLFDDKPAAVREMARVLRPGGTVVIADVTVQPGGLAPALQTAAARVACVADALALEGIERLLREAGLEVQACERHPDALAAMARRVEARLRAARMMRIPALEPFREQLAAAVELAREAERAIAAGVVGYALAAARRPG